MTKHFLSYFLLTIFFFGGSIWSQQLIHGDLQNFQGQHVPIEAFELDNGEFFVVRKKFRPFLVNDLLYIPRGFPHNSTVFIDRLDKQMNLLKSRELDINFDKAPEFSSLKGVLHNGQGTHLIYSKGNNKTDILELFDQKIDPISLDYIGKPELLGSVKLKNVKKLGNFPDVYQFFSSDEGAYSVSIATTLIDKETALLEITFFDEKLDKAETRKITFNIEDSFAEHVVDKEGRLFMIKEIRRKTEPLRFKLFHIDPSEDEPIVLDFRNDKARVFYPKLILNNEGKVNIAGISVAGRVGYYNQSLANLYASAWYFSIYNPVKKEFEFENVGGFQKEFASQYMSKKEKIHLNNSLKKNEPFEIDLPWIDFLTVTPSGRTIMMGEHSFATDKRTPGDELKLISQQLIVGSFAPDGTMEWFQKLPKRQFAAPKHKWWNSFGFGLNQEEIYLLYNDHQENNKDLNTTTLLKDLKEYKIRQPKYTAMARISDEGKVSRESLMEDSDNFLMPRMAIQIPTSGDLLLYGRDPSKAGSKGEVSQKYMMLKMK
ncbi:MAG: hypothetical protein MRZ79_24320 [Bacteroidia bacterium]|nr:hypothetical protein [Bacteroidia bacterium]